MILWGNIALNPGPAQFNTHVLDPINMRVMLSLIPILYYAASSLDLLKQQVQEYTTFSRICVSVFSSSITVQYN